MENKKTAEKPPFKLITTGVAENPFSVDTILFLLVGKNPKQQEEILGNLENITPAQEVEIREKLSLL